MKLQIYQPFLHDEHMRHISPHATPLDIRHNTNPNTREYELFKNLHGVHKLENDLAWGLVSWKFDLKTPIPFRQFLDFAQKNINNGADCVFVNPMIANEALYLNVWEQGISVGHAGLDTLVKHLGKSLPDIYRPMGRATFAFCNYFIGNRNFWDKYFEFSDSILKNLENEVLKKSAIGATYSGTGSYSKDRTITMRPFVIERIFSTFLFSAHNLNVQSFEYDHSHYILKFGKRLGDILHALSLQKNQFLGGNNNKQMQIDWDKARKKLLSSHARTIALHADDAPDIYLDSAIATK